MERIGIKTQCSGEFAKILEQLFPALAKLVHSNYILIQPFLLSISITDLICIKYNNYRVKGTSIPLSSHIAKKIWPKLLQLMFTDDTMLHIRWLVLWIWHNLESPGKTLPMTVRTRLACAYICGTVLIQLKDVPKKWAAPCQGLGPVLYKYKKKWAEYSQECRSLFLSALDCRHYV